jgi:glycosyltransferase involved in cell wall biosynthesis
MKILYFSRGYSPHDYRFLLAMVEAGHKPFFLPQTNSVSESRAVPVGVTALSGELKQAVAHSKPDLIHAGPLHEASYQAARTGFRPLVQMSWGSDILWQAKRNLLVRRRVALSLKHASVVIGDCDAVREAVIKFGVHSEKVVTFPWGIDLGNFRPGTNPDLRASLGWQNSFVILHLRSLELLYDPMTVARAFIRAARENSSLRLLMPGGGSLRSKVAALFAREGVSDRVSMPGLVAQNDLPGFYNASDLYVSASLSDGSSVSLIEALASGLPAAVTDIASNGEWITSGKEGWLFAARSERELSELMLKAAESKLADIRAAARLKAEQRADWSRNKVELFRAYDLAMETQS